MSFFAGMRALLRVRVIVVLSILYLFLVLYLYQYLWHSHSLEKGLGLLDDRDLPRVINSDHVQFNFKRRNGPLQENNETFEATWSLRGYNFSTDTNASNETSFLNLHSNTLFDVSNFSQPNYCIHAFYYMWYGNEHTDGRYMHWNHRYLPHWKLEVTKRYPTGRHVPPDDIGANFYPELGCYSSKDPLVIEQHMYQLRKADVGVVSVSWYPPNLADDEGDPPDALIPVLLDIAHKYSIRVTLHLEPYSNRSPQSVRNDLIYIHENYFAHPAFYKHTHTVSDNHRTGQRITKSLPLVYIYDSYLNKPKEWVEILKPYGKNTIRGTAIDCVVLGLLVDESHKKAIVDGGFDGFYTYFASNGFSYGSSTSNWQSLSKLAQEHKLLFIPSFGPGYIDTRVRPWNKRNSKGRQNGKYYKNMFQSAIRAVSGVEGGGGIVSLTSFNEWHEGTQIEAAVPKSIPGFRYLDYTPHQPDFYLELTKETAANLQCG